MFTNPYLENIFSYIILFLFIALMILALTSTAHGYRSFFDKDGAKRGLKKSLPYTLASFVLMSIYMVVIQPSQWINALCFMIVGPIFILLLYGIQYWQLKATEKYLEKHVQQKENDK